MFPNLQPGEKENLRVDVRPSDAINVARRCRVCCYAQLRHYPINFLSYAISIGSGGSLIGLMSLFYLVSPNIII